jgi:hypothetical protein
MMGSEGSSLDGFNLPIKPCAAAAEVLSRSSFHAMPQQPGPREGFCA